jgi:hypothetical protein
MGLPLHEPRSNGGIWGVTPIMAPQRQRCALAALPALGRAAMTAVRQLVPYQATFARLTMRRRRGSAVWRFRQAM